MIKPLEGRSSGTFDYSRQIKEGGLGGPQLLAILMLGLLVLFDGMDGQLLGLIANDMSRDLGIAMASFGIVFSAALVGAVAGALLLSLAADQSLGRKRVVILGMCVAGVGTLITAHTGTLAQLLVARFVTGAGLGAALPNLVSLASEFAPERMARRVVTLMIAFVPLGSLLGSVLARAILPWSDWQTLLYVAGGLTLTVTALAWVIVPESIQFLVLNKQDQGRAVAATRKLFRAQEITAVTVEDHGADRSTKSKQPMAILFKAGLWKLTLLFWLAFIMDQGILYFVMNWTPALLRSSGMTLSAGMDAAATFGIGGAIGTVAQGWLTTRYNIYKVMYVEIALYVVAMLAMPAVLGDSQAAPALVFVIAATICAYHAGLITLVLEAFPERIKSTAFGWSFGIGRIGASLAPVLAGFLLGIGWRPAHLFVAASLMGAATGLALFGLHLVKVGWFKKSQIAADIPAKTV